MKFECHFSWQAQYSVKFGMIAGARNVVFFNTKCSWLVKFTVGILRLGAIHPNVNSMLWYKLLHHPWDVDSNGVPQLPGGNKRYGASMLPLSCVLSI